MDWLKAIIEKVEGLFKWWIVVLPWEQGIRIRLGNRIKILNPGVYFRIPYLDTCFVHHTRLHFINLSPQTINTKDGKTVTVTVIVGYILVDISKMYSQISDFESTICGVVQQSNTQYIYNTDFNNCTVQGIEKSAIQALERTDWGIEIKQLSVSSFFESKVYRLVQDSAWMPMSYLVDTKR
jgi:regulator of protease activity HflC (stomatin/prohibitin superfamily)